MDKAKVKGVAWSGQSREQSLCAKPWKWWEGGGGGGQGGEEGGGGYILQWMDSAKVKGVA